MFALKCVRWRQRTNISVQLDEEVVGGIKAVGDSDQMQKSESAARAANCGATVRPQRSTLSTKSKSENAEDINDTISCPRGGTIASSVPFPFPASAPAREICLSDFLPVHSAPGLDESNRWHSVRPRAPRSSLGNRLEQRHKFKLPFPLASSLPSSTDKKLHAAAPFESGAQMISEWMLCNALHSLPHRAAAVLAGNQLKAASDCGISRSLPLPCQSLCRPLPKGALEIQHAKALHDDGNSALIPGIWTSSLGDEVAVLHFIG